MEESSQVLRYWSDLPLQLLPLIGERLDTHIDVLRFRSVCRSWRDSLPKSDDKMSPNLSDSFLLFNGSTDKIVVFRRMIYSFSPIDHHQSSKNSASSPSSSGWLAMIENTKLRSVPVLCPTNSDSVKSSKRGVNLMDFRIHEVAKSYFVGLTQIYNAGVSITKRVVVLPDSNCFIIVGIHRQKLVFMKQGDQNWNKIEETNSLYDDVIVYKGQIHTIDRHGRVFSMDSSMKLVQISPPMSGVAGNLKYLVECGGELYVVDRFLERKTRSFLIPDWFDIRLWCCGHSIAKSIDFKVHWLDRDSGRWVEVDDLGNHSFVLGMDCFSVSTSDLEGLEGSCIYFSQDINSDFSSGYGNYVFDLRKRSILNSSVQIFRGPADLNESWSLNANSSKRIRLE